MHLLRRPMTFDTELFEDRLNIAAEINFGGSVLR